MLLGGLLACYVGSINLWLRQDNLRAFTHLLAHTHADADIHTHTPMQSYTHTHTDIILSTLGQAKCQLECNSKQDLCGTGNTLCNNSLKSVSFYQASRQAVACSFLYVAAEYVEICNKKNK